MTATVTAPLRLELPHFSGTLAEVAAALRSGTLLPSEVPLLELTRRALERYRALEGIEGADLASEALPQLAAVIALKARLLLPPEPQPDPADPEDPFEDPLDEVAQSVQALADLEAVVSFLQTRRAGRGSVIPARPAALSYPRKERPHGQKGLAKLVQAARSAVREVTLAMVARDRLTLPQAREALLAFASRLRVFLFGAVHADGWGERCVYFAALLESVRLGEVEAEQHEAYGPLEVRALRLPEVFDESAD
ncbi:segregation and condensation protein A [Deinobacterium chartae]|uniref:Segregation and condensation protein A n=1 Tax=Deinobacterium chartae TaxID=521158 RepID=A0A841HZZ9_9DEIO|nr:segregation/condensation protein A [Deinobacterium chartae]MBB6097315.1 segregation and condensation protein A [Deinobacterium chartae]